MRPSFVLALLLLPIPLGSGCNYDDGGNSNYNHNQYVPPASPCPGAAVPEALVAPVHTVGTGSAASCDDAALRDAVDAVNAAGEGAIDFDCGSASHTVVLDGALEVTADRLVVDGGGLVALSGDERSRVINGDHYVNLVVQNLAIVNARATDFGAGIHLPWYGSLKVINAHFENNRCTENDHDIGGGAFYAGGCEEVVVSESTFVGNRGANGGAVCVNGSNLTIVNSLFEDNRATGSGGGAGGGGHGGIGGAVYIDGMYREDDAMAPFVMCGVVFRDNEAGDHASGIFRHCYPGSSSTISHCLFESNRVTGADSGMAALYHQESPLTLLHTTFAYNTTNLHAGALYLGADNPTEIENCTFVGNEVPEVGAGIFAANNTVTITNSTFTDHVADYGPAIFRGENGRITLHNCIFANNLAHGEYNGQSCNETLLGGANNMQWPATRPNGGDDRPCTEGVLFADPRLQPLGDNGGATPTRALESGSPAIGAGIDCPDTDQRDEPRGTPCALGAYEP